MSLDETQRRLDQYFAEKLREHGPTARGVDYNSDEAQERRFEQLTKVIRAGESFSILDYGCGYGAMFEFLLKKGLDFEYHGLDRIEAMVRTGREKYGRHGNAHFHSDESTVPPVDYLVAGAIFNIKLEATLNDWREFVCESLRHMIALCTRGLAFNMLTSYSDADRMATRPDLFYADPLFFFDFCKRNLAPNVALLHDYGLFDFTILVRKDL